MKLRLRGNSIRIRLMQGEVKGLLEKGQISEEVLFPDNPFTYALKVSSSYSASFCDSRMEICIPEADAVKWIIDENELSLSASMNIANGDPIKILIEKDLACINARDDEDDSDAFPNPKSSC